MLATFIISLVLIFICVSIHYEALSKFESICSLLGVKGRLKVIVATLWAIFAHTVEVWVFATGYYLLNYFSKANAIIEALSQESANFLDMVYFSFITYTSVGYGDWIPLGSLRFMAGTESLAGLVFIGWTASFLYLKMEQNWHQEKE